ncbi:unnamed protein product [Penicillium olsonii]|uniref:Uncharacterized protein n=1 Tax=Penicillium olsonii TaxID=99116 RepID=A0A9W4HNH4_PENOL|nr:unnamed protein product [Penicillium olsonii]
MYTLDQTPLIPVTITTAAQKQFSSTPIDRPRQPNKVTTYFIFLTNQDNSFISRQSLYPNRRVVVNG